MTKLKGRISRWFSFRSLAFRLTIWYAGVFLIVAFLLFGGLYILLYSLILKQADAALHEKERVANYLIVKQGLHSLQEDFYADTRLHSEWRLINEDSVELLISNPAASDLDLSAVELKRLVATKQPFFKTVKLNSKVPVRVGSFYQGPDTILQVWQSLEASYTLLNLIKLVFLLGLIGAFILTVFLSAVLAGNLLQMINNVTQTAAEIAKGSLLQLDRRVYVGKENNEISEMARTFNTMLERIQNLVSGMEEMSDNMAHDLKSPVTRIRGLTEVTLMHESTLEEYERMGADIIGECDTLLGMINNILFITKAKHGVYVPKMSAVDLNALTAQAHQMFQPLAESKGLELTCVLSDTPLTIMADKKLLQRALANLIDNAIKYSSDGGFVNLVCSYENDYAILKVCDAGNGIPAEDIDRIFERFYRSDASRSSEGSGLGLSFVKVAVEAMYGFVRVESVLSKGSCFALVFKIFDKSAIGDTKQDLLDTLVKKINEENNN